MRKKGEGVGLPEGSGIVETINLEADYFDHPKTRRLIGLLGKGSEVLPIRLWCWCARYHAENGMLTDYSTQEIESCVGWWGEPGQFVEAMVKVGFMESNGTSYYVHEFAERNGHIAAFKERAKKGAEARWSKIRDASSNATSIPKQCSTYLPTELPTKAEDTRENKTPAAAAAPEVRKPETISPKRDTMAFVMKLASEHKVQDFSWLEGMLLHEWGREGRVGCAVNENLRALGKEHGIDRLKYAIHEAARHGKKSLAYVEAILAPKAKDPDVNTIKACRQCGHRWDPLEEAKVSGSSLCPVCFPVIALKEVR
jgi:hypothetical protein